MVMGNDITYFNTKLKILSRIRKIKFKEIKTMPRNGDVSNQATYIHYALINNKEPKQEFIEFLLCENSFDNYMKNISYRKKNINDICNPKKIITSYINQFSWDETKEGYNHWANLHQKWIKFVRNKLGFDNMN